MGAEFLPSIPLFNWRIIGIGLAANYLFCGSLLAMGGYTNAHLLGSVLRLIVSLGLNLFLIPIFGLTGAAMAVCTLYLYLIIHVQFLIKWKTGIGVVW
jgi:O-antigen/teichoic acid export membrane protein